MYGQGSYAPQFRHGPPPPPPPPQYPQAPHEPPTPFPQLRPGPPPPPIPRAPHLPPPPIYHHPTYFHPRPVAQTGFSYPQAMPAPNPHHHPSPMMQPRVLPPPPPRVLPPPPPPRVLPPPPPRVLLPPPPPPRQGQVLYRTPPAPLGIQLVPTSSPPAQPNFFSISPQPFAPFTNTPSGDARPPSIPQPPPPPPPSSPPPTPPSPPNSQEEDLRAIRPEEPSSDSMENVDAPACTAHSTDNVPAYGDKPRGEACTIEDEVPLVKRDELGLLSSPPHKPVEEEVVRNIEVLCEFIAKVGPDFENSARIKEAGNPEFAFLFGGEPGSAAAIGHQYFQWLKRKYQSEANSHKGSEQNVSSEIEGPSHLCSLEVERAAASPAESDMDMEDVSPVRASSDAAENALQDIVQGPVRITSGDFDQVKVSPKDAAEKMEDNSRVFVEDREPFQLIQGEIEIDQVQFEGKSKKSKDSRSMKLFKSALADFVKEVLKPSWRQGNMSKEAFKTIVKKTVDKAAGAVPSHQIPKTQVKINQYVESSQRKLTKLVMGYVDKYVKM